MISPFICCVAVIDFVNLFTTTIPAFDPATVEYARFISELALQHDQFLQFLPSMVATAICSYALLAQERPLWVSVLLHFVNNAICCPKLQDLTIVLCC